MISFRSDVQERLSHRPECKRVSGVHVLLDRTRGGWGNTWALVTLVCCECEVHETFHEVNDSHAWLVRYLWRVVELRLCFDEEPACSGCSGPRHTGWCGA